MEKRYYLSNKGAHIGPYSFEVILNKISNQEHQWTDYVYDETAGEWLMLLEHPEFATKMESSPQVPEIPSIEKKNPLKDKEWFILKSGNNYGPFAQMELIQMLQEKTLFEYDYIWHSKLPAWKRVAEVEDYQADNIRTISQTSDKDMSEVFFRRRHARCAYGASLIVHNSKSVFRGQALEISAGGAGVLIENNHLVPGQSLFLHFQPGDGVPPFNAVCQVVSKQFVEDPNAMVKYGVRFTNLTQTARESIRNFTTKAA